MARLGHYGSRCRGFLRSRHEGAGAGKPLTVALLLADEATAEALETDLLRYGVDLLDLYRGFLSYRRVCALVSHLPDNAAVWRVHDPHGAMTRAELVLATVERRVTALWATVAVALGQDVTDDQLSGPLDTWTPPARTPPGTTADRDDAELKSLREIARWMRSG